MREENEKFDDEELWYVEETKRAAERVIRDVKSVFATGSYIIIHHDVEKNEISSDWQMCYDENGGPEQIMEKMLEYISDIYGNVIRVRRVK